MIKAVITYYYKGATGVMGTTIGADGAGEYAIIITGDDFIKVDQRMYEEAKKLAEYPRITDIVMVIQESSYDAIIKEIQV